VFTPNQCYASNWNVNKEVVRSIEKDFSLMKEWLEEQGAEIEYLTLIRGVSLSQECLKLSTDKYGVGIMNQESSELLSTLGFVLAAPQQVKLFTDTTNVGSLQLLYKTKFCDAQPWGMPDLTIGNEEEVAERAMEWLAELGIASYETPTIHKINPSFTGTCGTDAGLGILITIPAWSETHLTPYGFQKLTPAFNIQESQIYPMV
jgi:hypothetical protein